MPIPRINAEIIVNIRRIGLIPIESVISNCENFRLNPVKERIPIITPAAAHIIATITKTICESTEELKQIHVEAGKYNADTTKPLFDDPVVPFHPGALKYYKEIWQK